MAEKIHLLRKISIYPRTYTCKARDVVIDILVVRNTTPSCQNHKKHVV